MAGEKFSTQRYLERMEDAATKRHESLGTKVDDGFASVAKAMAAHELKDHELFSTLDKRVSIVENTRKLLLGLGSTAAGAVILVAVEYFFNHFKGK